MWPELPARGGRVGKWGTGRGSGVHCVRACLWEGEDSDSVACGLPTAGGM